jgi:hypothetical protein
MGLEHDAGVVEQLMGEWNSLRVTEAYRRVHFTLLRDEAIVRWSESGPHDEIEVHFVEHRVSRGEHALGEVRELEDRSDVAFAQCRSDLDGVESLSKKDRERTITRVRDVASRALREEMRYRTALLGTLHHEVNELTTFVDDSPPRI